MDRDRDFESGQKSGHDKGGSSSKNTQGRDNPNQSRDEKGQFESDRDSGTSKSAPGKKAGVEDSDEDVEK